MKEVLAQICALQPHYSSSNTPQMQERGRLVRTELTAALRERLPRLQQAFDSVFDDLEVDASDGIGRKTEAPWARVFSKTMSPNPRNGFYLVIHFAADGSAVFITIGCGSTVWNAGDLRPVSDDELARRTSWARGVVQQRWGLIAPFVAHIKLGAKAPLTRTFEKSTALAIRVPANEFALTDIDAILQSTAERLGEIYLAQLDQRDVTPAEQDSAAIEEISRPLKRRPGGQGIGLTAPERKAVELRAMALAVGHLTELGYQCKDTSATESFDLVATIGTTSLKIEVKGTTSDVCDSVLMTKNEVNLHRMEKGKTGLLIVYGIRLKRGLPAPQASGGTVEAMIGWDIDTWRAQPVAFQLYRQRAEPVKTKTTQATPSAAVSIDE